MPRLYPLTGTEALSFLESSICVLFMHRRCIISQSQEAERFIRKEEPASPSLTQQSGMWSSVSLHPDNGISSELDIPGNNQETERWELSQAQVSHPTIRKAQLAEPTNALIHFLDGIAAARPQRQQLFQSRDLCLLQLSSWHEELQQCQNLKCFVQYSDVFDWHVYLNSLIHNSWFRIPFQHFRINTSFSEM